MSAVLPQIWLRLIADPAFAARLREDFATTLQAEGYTTNLPISDLPSVYRWHTALRSGAAANRLQPPAGMRRARVSGSHPSLPGLRLPGGDGQPAPLSPSAASD